MVLADDTLFIVGPCQIADLFTETPHDDVLLWSLSASEGTRLGEVRLPVAPVFDSIAVSDRSLYMTTVDGRVWCFRGQDDLRASRLSQ